MWFWGDEKSYFGHRVAIGLLKCLLNSCSDFLHFRPRFLSVERFNSNCVQMLHFGRRVGWLECSTATVIAVVIFYCYFLK